MQNAVAGDTVYFLGGKYDVGQDPLMYHGALEPSNSGTPQSPIVFAAYPEANVILNGTAGGTNNDQGTVLGVAGHDYITFDGFKIQSDNGVKAARVIIWGTDTGIAYGVTVKNMEIYGGTTLIASHDNRDGLRVEKTDGTLIQNVKIYSFRQIDNYQNTACYKGYHNTNLIIEKSEFTNCTTGIYFKSDHDDATVRYNYVHNNYRGMTVYAFLTEYNTNGKIEHNVFSNNQYSSLTIIGEETATTDNYEINNNTFYGPSSSKALFYSQGSNYKVWNNIIQGHGNNQYMNGYDNIQVSASDHNQFGTSPLKILTHRYQADSQTYSSIPSWQASGELLNGGNPGEGSLASDPQFVNDSGNFSKLSDFQLKPTSPCTTGGRNNSIMGANINLVGYKPVGKIPKAPVLH
jgi:hypothetical protein